MKLILSIVCSMLVLQINVAAAEFYDPMRPPPYALNKLRLEQSKKNGPVKKAPGSEVKKATWVLSSILFSSQRQHAIINNRLVKKGDVIRGAKLIRVKPDSVRLLAKGKIIDLSLRKANQSIKKSLPERKL